MGWITPSISTAITLGRGEQAKLADERSQTNPLEHVGHLCFHGTATLETSAASRRFWSAPPTGWATRSCPCPPCARCASDSRKAASRFSPSPGWPICIAAKPFCDELIPYTARTFFEKWAAARALRARKFDTAILLQNAFEAAAIAYLAGIPERIGYARDGRGFLLTRAIPVPEARRDPAARAFLLPGTAAPRRESWTSCPRTTSSAWKALPPRARRAWIDSASSGWARS